MTGSRAALPDMGLSAERVLERLDTVWVARPFEFHAVLASTNDTAFERAASGAAAGLAIAADAQVAGRGRRGRAFESRAGLGLWTSVLAPPPSNPANAPRLSLLAALAAARAVEAVTGASPRVKWPNDLLLGGRKVAGILVEARSTGAALFVVAGIGINVHHRLDDFAAPLRNVAGSLFGQTGVRVDRADLAARLYAELESVLDAEARGGVDLAAAFGERDAFAGKDVVVQVEGERATIGRADGVAPDGRLRVRLEDGTTAIFQVGNASLKEV